MKLRGPSRLLLLVVWMLYSSWEAGWIWPSPFLSSWGGDSPTQSNKNSFVLDLNHSSPLIFRSASCSLMQSWQNLLAASVKSRLFWTSGIKNTMILNTHYTSTSRNPTKSYTLWGMIWTHLTWEQGMTTRGYSANSELLTRHHRPLGCLSGMLPCVRNVVLVSVPLPEAGGGSCQGEVCSHSEASTACSLSEHDGKCASLFSIFTKCKSVKPLMVCHLDGNCSPFRGRQVKRRACGYSRFLL